jgi:hypothetical protein
MVGVSAEIRPWHIPPNTSQKHRSNQSALCRRGRIYTKKSREQLWLGTKCKHCALRSAFDFCRRVQLKCDGTLWRTGGEVKGKLANGVGSQYSHTSSEHGDPALLTMMRTPRLPAVDWTDAPADLNGLVRFGKRRNLVSARVPSRFKRSLLPLMRTPRLSVIDWTDTTADLNGLVRFAERRNLVSARVPSHSTSDGVDT